MSRFFYLDLGNSKSTLICFLAVLFMQPNLSYLFSELVTFLLVKESQEANK